MRMAHMHLVPSGPRLGAVRLNKLITHTLYGAFLALAACVLATPAAAADASADTSDAGLALLQKIQSAARELDYSGIYTYQQGAVMLSSRIVHIVDGTGERERIEMLDGAPREFIRHNEVTQCLIPEKKAIVLEKRRGDRFPALILGDGQHIPDHYHIKTGAAKARIAGRECSIVELVPKDGHRYGYKLCADTETHLLLKAQTVGPDGMVDQMSFNSLEVGGQAAAAQVNSSWNTKGWKVVETPMTPVDLAQRGWRIPQPPGFEAVTQVSRSMKRGKQVNQLVITDGLAAISVFIESYEPSSHPPPTGALRAGAMNVFQTRIGDYWLTTLGEVPAATLRDIAERTEYVPLARH